MRTLGGLPEGKLMSVKQKNSTKILAIAAALLTAA